MSNKFLVNNLSLKKMKNIKNVEPNYITLHACKPAVDNIYAIML